MTQKNHLILGFLLILVILCLGPISTQAHFMLYKERSQIQREGFFYYFYPDGWKIIDRESNMQYEIDSGQYKWNGEFLLISDDRFNPYTHSTFGINQFYHGNYPRTLAVADFIIKNMTEDGFLLYNYPIGYFNINVPWVSGLSQSYAIRCLLRAEEISDNSSYLEAAQKILHSYTYPWEVGGLVFSKENYSREQGGFAYNFGEESAWYLECGTINEEELEFVLNGHIAALFGLWEYSQHPDTPNKTLASTLFDKGLNALINNIHTYEEPFGCSKYSLRIPGKKNYMRKHVYQLEFLFRSTNNPILKYYYDYWKPSYYLNVEYAPNITSLIVYKTDAGINITWETDIPSKAALEWGDGFGFRYNLAYMNSTLSNLGSFFVESLPYDRFRVYFANADNITRIHMGRFSDYIFEEITTQRSTTQTTVTQTNTETSTVQVGITQTTTTQISTEKNTSLLTNKQMTGTNTEISLMTSTNVNSSLISIMILLTLALFSIRRKKERK